MMIGCNVVPTDRKERSRKSAGFIRQRNTQQISAPVSPEGVEFNRESAEVWPDRVERRRYSAAVKHGEVSS
jgi:hypothetical protein